MGKKTGHCFPFREQRDTAVLTCSHVLDGKAPILYVTHDEEDGMRQFLCGAGHTVSEARLVSLEEILSLDSTVGALSEMPPGYFAVRKRPDDDWMLRQK